MCWGFSLKYGYAEPFIILFAAFLTEGPVQVDIQSFTESNESFHTLVSAKISFERKSVKQFLIYSTIFEKKIFELKFAKFIRLKFCETTFEK